MGDQAQVTDLPFHREQGHLATAQLTVYAVVLPHRPPPEPQVHSHEHLHNANNSHDRRPM
jgi:hypothetical protein